MNQEKPNFQRELDNLISEISKEERPTLLLHSCCGPCSSHCLSYLRDYFNITVFYYNPNIYPEEEYDHRLSEQIRLIDELNRETGAEGEERIKLIHFPYDHGEFLEAAKGLEGEPEGGARCAECFRLRLLRTAALASEMEFDYFGTTLTVSPHKNAIVINTIGSEIADSLCVALEVEEVIPAWLPSDFKKKDGYKHSIELSRKYDLYRQDYCGCEYSMQDCESAKCEARSNP